MCVNLLPGPLISSFCMSLCVYSCVFWSGFGPLDLGIQSLSTFQRSSILVLVLAQYYQKCLGAPCIYVCVARVCVAVYIGPLPDSVTGHDLMCGTSINSMGALLWYFCW